MSIEKVRAHFKQFGIENKILEFDSSSATVELAAQALNCEPKRIAKTLSFDLGGRYILVVTAGDARIDNLKFKQQFKSKAKMISAENVKEIIGHCIGGVCPFAIKKDVGVYLDSSLKRFKSIFPACGSANSAIELTPLELEKYSNSIFWVDVCRNWQK